MSIELSERIGPMAAAHMGYDAGFGDASFRATQIVFQAQGIGDLTRAIEAMRPIESDEFDGPEIYLAAALDEIDGEAPAKEPRDRPTVGFPPSRDPGQDDGNDVVEEAFREGVARGLWIAANIARPAIARARGES